MASLPPYVPRDLAASTVFSVLYIGAVERTGRYLGPAHVHRMTKQQAGKSSDADREAYAAAVLKKNGKISGERWYADNTREPVRDETLRDGLVAIAAFQSSGGTARTAIMRAGAATSDAGVLVTFPDGGTRPLAPGPSTPIVQAVVEVFAERFLEKPAVVWLSESGNKVVVRDDRIVNAIGLKIEADKNLPDLILADLGPKEPPIVFVEVVATDGAMTPRRQEALHALAAAAGFDRKHVAFLTAYRDRQSAGFKKTVAQLGWGSLPGLPPNPSRSWFSVMARRMGRCCRRWSASDRCGDRLHKAYLPRHCPTMMRAP